MSVRQSLCNRENIYDAVGGGMRAEVVRQHLSGPLRREPGQAWVFSSCPPGHVRSKRFLTAPYGL